MELYDAIFRQPHDVWNLIGGLLLLVVGLISLIMTRRPLMQVIDKRREEGASEEELRDMRQRLGLVMKLMAVADLVILPLAGYFLFGPVFREVFGG